MLSRNQVASLFHRDLFSLIAEAHQVHSLHFKSGEMQLSTLLSIKTGGCPENCSYCPQSAHYAADVKRESLMSVDQVKKAAERAKASGATRFCMGAAWREVRDGQEFDQVLEMVRGVKELGLEACCTLGMINESQAQRLKEAGLHSYNHNIDTSRDYYSKIISTRTYDDRLDTIATVRKAGLKVCTGGIVGMGESEEDRIDFLYQLASFDPQPESVTVNALVPVEGTPLAEQQVIPALDVARVIAVARILIPESRVRLSAGRKTMTPEGQFLCFYAGANSIFLGDKLLTSPNPSVSDDNELFRQTGVSPLRIEPAVGEVVHGEA